MIGEGQIGNAEAAPVHVDGFRGATLEVHRAEGEDVLAVQPVGDAFVGDGAVVEVLDRVAQLLQAVLQTRAAGEQLVAHVGQTGLGTILGALVAGVGGNVGAFGEDEEPHRAERRPGESAEAVVQAGTVGSPFAGHKDEAVEHHGGAEQRHVLEGLFEDDVDGAVHGGVAVGISGPPQVQPVGVELVVGHEHDAAVEAQAQHARTILGQTAGHGSVTADTHRRRAPPLRHGGDEQAEEALRMCHPGIEGAPRHEIQRRAQQLRCVDKQARTEEVEGEGQRAHARDHSTVPRCTSRVVGGGGGAEPSLPFALERCRYAAGCGGGLVSNYSGGR